MTSFPRVFVVVLFTVAAAGQVTTVTQDEYFGKYSIALEKSRATPRRRTQQTEFVEPKGRRIVTEVEEVDSRGRFRFVSSEKAGTKTTITETIVIGEQRYCRVDRRPWKKGENGCESGARFGSGAEAVFTFTIEKGELNAQPIILLRAYSTSADDSSATNRSSGTTFSDNKLWVSTDGLIIKREYTTGRLPDKIESKLVESYEYNPKNLNIVAPIK